MLRLPCFTHTLQLVVSDGFKESKCTKAAMTKVSSIARCVHKSTAMTERLDQDAFCIPIPLVTRCNSQYYTAAKIIQTPSDKLNENLRELKKDSLVLSQRDLAILNEFVSVFAMFAEACSTRAQAAQAASISLVGPSLLEINFDLESKRTTLKYNCDLRIALIKLISRAFRWVIGRAWLNYR